MWSVDEGAATSMSPFETRAFADAPPSFIFWALAYFTLHQGAKKWDGPIKSIESIINYGLILIGVYIIGAGTYVSTLFLLDGVHAGVCGVYSGLSGASPGRDLGQGSGWRGLGQVAWWRATLAQNKTT